MINISINSIFLKAERNQIMVKVEEDPNRQKILAAIAASASTAQATYSTNNQIVYPQASYISSIHGLSQTQNQQSRLTPLPLSDNHESDKMET